MNVTGRANFRNEVRRRAAHLTRVQVSCVIVWRHHLTVGVVGAALVVVPTRRQWDRPRRSLKRPRRKTVEGEPFLSFWKKCTNYRNWTRKKRKGQLTCFPWPQDIAGGSVWKRLPSVYLFRFQLNISWRRFLPHFTTQTPTRNPIFSYQFKPWFL